MKHVFLGLFAILGYTTVMVYEPEQQHQNIGYSQNDVAGMNRLIDRATAKPDEKPAQNPERHHNVWTAQQESDAVDALFGRKGIN